MKVELKNTSLSIPSSVLKEMSADLKIEIKTLTDTEKQNVLTNLNGLKATGPVIEFTLTSVEGNVQNSVTKFKEKVTIEIGAEGIILAIQIQRSWASIIWMKLPGHGFMSEANTIPQQGR